VVAGRQARGWIDLEEGRKPVDVSRPGRREAERDREDDVEHDVLDDRDAEDDAREGGLQDAEVEHDS
jgi:hypothetical protein